jgi:hypothetical protein
MKAMKNRSLTLLLLLVTTLASGVDAVGAVREGTGC